jgi:hypothetical protein
MVFLISCGSEPGPGDAGVQETAPTSLRYSDNPVTYVVGVPITPNVPSSTGGEIVAYYMDTPLPSGLVLDKSSGVISGTPTATAPRATFVVRAGNFVGDVRASLDITVSQGSGRGGGNGGGGTSILSFTIADGCSDGRGLLVRFFDKTNNLVWPNSSQAYTIGAGGSANFPLSCKTGAQICYGGSTNPETSYYWGVGLQDNESCDHCCATCDNAAYSFTLTCH